MSCTWLQHTFLTYFSKTNSIQVDNTCTNSIRVDPKTIVNAKIVTSFEDQEKSAITIQYRYRKHKLKTSRLNAVFKIQCYAIPYIEKQIKKKFVSIRTKRFNMTH